MYCFVQLSNEFKYYIISIPYYEMRPALSKEEVIAGNKEIFSPALKGFTQMQQNGDLSVIQNVGYPETTVSL
jgi:hypothetical protein